MEGLDLLLELLGVTSLYERGIKKQNTLLNDTK